jgi:hypothetical protein
MSDPSQFTEMEWIRFLDIEPLLAEAGRAVIDFGQSKRI